MSSARRHTIAYGLDWHLTGSAAIDALLIEPLAEMARIEFRPWDGETISEPIESGRPTIFFMLPPPQPVLTSPAPVVWIPMWDHARIYDQAWWDALPHSLRVVAFSEPIRRRAESAGLTTQRVHYFTDPAGFPPAAWGANRVAHYWNRTGMVGPEGLDRFCRALSVSKLLFRPQLDPRVPVELHYTLPSKLGETEIETIEPRTRDEFLEATASANLVVAPRNAEGVGLTFLEAMARGCCVFGYDAPTMNEYISDGKNGMLFRLRESRLRFAARRVRGRPMNAVDIDQPWRRLSRTDPHGLGDQARADHVAGRRRWIESVPAYGRFILDW